MGSEMCIRDRNIKLDISDAALALVAEMGFDPVYGARPLKRSIQTLIENPLAQRILAGDFSSGDVVSVSVKDDQLTFDRSSQH